MVGQHEVQYAIFAQSNHGCSRQVILCGRAIDNLFVVAAHKMGCFAINHAFYPFPIAVIDKLRNRRPVFLDFHQPVFGIISQVEGVRADGAGGLVAVTIINIGDDSLTPAPRKVHRKLNNI